MADSSEAITGDASWLPSPGGARTLRAPGATGAVLVLAAEDGERRIPSADGAYVVEAELVSAGWASAWLEWPNRARRPLPPPPHAEIVDSTVLAERRARRLGTSPGGAVAAGLSARAAAPPPVEAPPPAAELAAAEPAAPPAAATEPAAAAPPALPPSPPAATAEPAAAAPPAPLLPRAEDAPAALPGDVPPRRSATPWTAPPEVTVADAAFAEAEWRARRADLDRELSRAADALTHAREAERGTRDAVHTALAGARADLRAARAARDADASVLVTLASELDAERIAHAVTRSRVTSLAEALAAARTELHVAHSSLVELRRNAGLARAESTMLRTQLDAARSAAAARSALLAQVADLDRRVPGAPHEEASLEHRAREQAAAAAAAVRRPPAATGRLLADLDAAAASLRRAAAAVTDEAPAHAGENPPAATAPADATTAPAAATAPPADATTAPAAATAPTADTTTAPAAATTAPADTEPPAPAPADGPAPFPAAPSFVAPPRPPAGHLRRGLVVLAREDPKAAGELLAALLPAQGAALEEAVSYDLTIRGTGLYAVDAHPGGATVQRVSRPRGRRSRSFHLDVDALTLAELLAGEERALRRIGPRPRLTGRRRRLARLGPLAHADVSLAQAVQNGARLEPALILRALPYVIEPDWTRGHAFTVAQEITGGAASRTWYVTARDGERVAVTAGVPPAPPDARVTMTRAAFDRLLRGEPAEPGDRPSVRGDRRAVAALRAWTDLARG